MAFNWLGLLLFVHVAGAALWLGASMFLKMVVMPRVDDAGDAGKQYMMTVAKWGGWGKYIGPIAIVTILAGLGLYFSTGVHSAAMDGNNIALTIGMVTGIIALGFGLLMTMPAERRVGKIAHELQGPPSDEQRQELGTHIATASKGAMFATIFAAITFALMVGRHVFV